MPAEPAAEVPPESVERIRPALLDWYRTHRRDLPWRSSADPYAVWVSEAMLQQTQVQTVVPYFLRWMSRFPTVAALAEASLEDVLGCWAGLGYYARARNLHTAARVVVERHGGMLPADAEALLALPGIGRYTAGAILSIAFGIPAPILDGNVIRVLSRLFVVEGDPTRGGVQRRLWALAAALVPAEAPGDFNQAMMELGATVCTPEAPSCATCPLTAWCGARLAGRTAELPQARRRPETVQVEHVSALIEKDGAVLLVRRPWESLWGGLWELPRAERRPDETLAECAERAAWEAVGIRIRAGERLAVVRHTVTHHRITLYAFAGERLDGTPGAVGCDAWEWVAASAVGERPLSAPQSRLLKLCCQRAGNIV